jgi:hypothetical protein
MPFLNRRIKFLSQQIILSYTIMKLENSYISILIEQKNKTKN